MEKITLKIGGMHCASCSAYLEKELSKTDGISNVSVSIATNTATFEYDKNIASMSEIDSVVKECGFFIDNEDENLKKKKLNYNLIFICVFSVLLLYTAMGQMIGLKSVTNNHTINAYIQLVLLLPILFFGRELIFDGVKSLFKLHPNMNSLVAIGSFASVAYSIYAMAVNSEYHHLYFESAGIIIMFVSIGKELEYRSKIKTGDAIRKLINIAPSTATAVIDGKYIEINVKDIKKDDILLLKPGESVAVDGIISEGVTSVDESMFTGESMPVDKKAGDKLIGGSINYNGSVTYTATGIGEEMLLNKIINLVKDTQNTKAPIQRLADKIAGIFVPTVFAIAFISAIIWIIIGKPFEFALQIFVSVLVIACPCSLGLATPMAIMVGSGLGASNGVLFKNAETIESLNEINCVVFDKTGTLTYGKPKVIKVVSNDKNKLISFAASLEQFSQHPLANAVLSYAEDCKKYKVEDFKSIDGLGLSGNIEGHKVLVGSSKFLDEKFDTNLTSIGVKCDHEFLGYITFADTIREEVPEVIDVLSKEKEIVMLSGDTKKVAENIAGQLNIKKVIANVMPDEKSSIIANLMKKYKVAMVGDGVNDSPALIKSDVGIAVMNGTDITIDSADVILMNENFDTILRAFKISKITIKNVKENLFWAFCYNCICIPIAAGVLYPLGILLNPMIAAMAMSMSSVSVVLNSLRIRNKKVV